MNKGNLNPPHFKQLLIGIVGAILVYAWWHSEVAAMLGERIAQDSFHCLLVAGTGECGALWWVGMHQENEIASLLFYGALGLAVWAFMKDKDL